jgi:hypothetical protein
VEEILYRDKKNVNKTRFLRKNANFQSLEKLIQIPDTKKPAIKAGFFCLYIPRQTTLT